MNGVRRFLGGGTTSPPAPTAADLPSATVPLTAKPSWPPQSPTSATSPLDAMTPTSNGSSPRGTTQGLFLRKDKTRPSLPVVDSRSSSPVAGPSTITSRQAISRKSPELYKRISPTINTRDELLISLLASQAVVDSRDSDILSSEEVEELKKEQHDLASRVTAMEKKLNLETKIRDAAVSLSRVNASHKKVSKQSEEQLENANRRVETAQKELYRISERANEVQRKLLEHRAGVLGFSLRAMERKMAPQQPDDSHQDSGYDTASRGSPMSPSNSSMTGVSSVSTKARFEGAHFFAGHENAQVPRKPPATSDIIVLEEKLKSATSALAAANKKQAEMARELSILKLEKEEVETTMGFDLQNAEETINSLEQELPRMRGLDEELNRLKEEKMGWEKDRMALSERTREVDQMRNILNQRQGEEGKAADLQRIQQQFDRDREGWEMERSRLEAEKRDEKSRLETEVNDALQAIQNLVQDHGIVMFSRDQSLKGLLGSVNTHLHGIKSKTEGYARERGEWDALRRKLEEDVRSGLDKREALALDLEEARREREEARRDARTLETQLTSPALSLASLPQRGESPLLSLGGGGGSAEIAKYNSILQPIWAVLPSPEARAAKNSASSRTYRTTSTGGTVTMAPLSPRPGASSMAELDVRTLKVLYDRQNTPGMPASPGLGPGSGSQPFSIEGFGQRVQALITDDKALIERLLRFAQAHDLLKRNAERAQKLAQESNIALETYQKQVRTLEERNMTLIQKSSEVSNQTHDLQAIVDRISAEKREIEAQAAKQADTIQQLTEANNTLSTRTLALAQEATAASGMDATRRQLETQLSECKTSLQKAQDEIDRIQESGQSQQIALLDELSSMQSENDKLRDQLRALKK